MAATVVSVDADFKLPSIVVTYPTSTGTSEVTLPVNDPGDYYAGQSGVVIAYSRDDPEHVVLASGPAETQQGAAGLLPFLGFFLGIPILILAVLGLSRAQRRMEATKQEPRRMSVTSTANPPRRREPLSATLVLHDAGGAVGCLLARQADWYPLPHPLEVLVYGALQIDQHILVVEPGRKLLASGALRLPPDSFATTSRA